MAPGFRRSRRRRRPPQPQIPLERIEQGEGGERAVQDWLDRSHLATGQSTGWIF